MAKKMQDFGARVSSLEARVLAKNLDNFVRRDLYSKVELLRLDMGDTIAAGKTIIMSY